MCVSCVVVTNRMSHSLLALTHSMEYKYLNNVPILTLDVNEDFKVDQVKGADMVEKVRIQPICFSWELVLIFNAAVSFRSI